MNRSSARRPSNRKIRNHRNRSAGRAGHSSAVASLGAALQAAFESLEPRLLLAAGDNMVTYLASDEIFSSGRWTTKFVAEMRYGNNGLDGDFEVDVAYDTSAPQAQAQCVWQSGNSYPFTVTYSPGSGFSMTVNGVRASFNPDNWTAASNIDAMVIRARAYANRPDSVIQLSNLTITLPSGSGIALPAFDGYGTEVVTGSASNSPTVQDLLVHGEDLQGGFTLAGTAYWAWGTPLPTGSRLSSQIKIGEWEEWPPETPCPTCGSGRQLPGAETCPAQTDAGTSADGNSTVTANGPSIGATGRSLSADLEHNTSPVDSGAPAHQLPSGYNPTWNHLLAPQLRHDGASIAVVEGDRSSRIFAWNGTTYSDPDFPKDELKRNAGNSLYTLTTEDKTVFTFHDFDNLLDPAIRGRFISMVTKDGTTRLATNPDSAAPIPSFTQTSNNVTETAALDYVSSGYNAGLVSRITLSRGSTTIRDVDYAYTSGSSTKSGMLKLMTTMDANENVLDVSYYRYDTSDRLTYSFGGDAYARLSAFATSQSKTVDQLTDTEAAPYADESFEYDSNGRVYRHTTSGAGCSLCNGQGTAEDAYAVNSSWTPGPNNWKTKTTETNLGDNTAEIIYANDRGQEMLRVGTIPGSSDKWVSYTRYDSQYRPILSAGPAAFTPVSGAYYNEANLDLLDFSAGNSPYLSDDSGAFALTMYYDETTATDTTAGGVADYVRYSMLRQGEAGSSPVAITALTAAGGVATATAAGHTFAAGDVVTIVGASPAGYDGTFIVASVDDDEFTYAVAAGLASSATLASATAGHVAPQSAADYIARTVGGETVYRTNSITQYRDDAGDDPLTTTYDYTWFTDALLVQSVTTTLPAATTGQNGSGVAPSTTDVYDSFGRAIWSRDAAGFLSDTAYDATTGAVVKTIADVDTTRTGDFTGLPSGWATPAGGGAHLVTTYESDTQGRTTKTTDPDGVVSYTVYNDVGHETRTYSGWHAVTGGYTTTGPVQVYRDDPAAAYSESFSFTAPTFTAAVPDGTETIGTIQSLSRSILNYAGQMIESREYFDFTGLTYSTARDLGAEGTNYLSTRYVYDTRGRSAVMTDAAGVDSHTFYDGLSRTTASWIGSDDLLPELGDLDEDGYDDNDLNKDGVIDLRDFRKWVADNPTATEGPTGTDMVKVSASVYDAGGVGDSNLTLSRAYVSATETLETDYAYDWRDRQTDSRGPDNVAVHCEFDNLGETTTVQTYADANADFVIDTGELRAQSESLYDDQGRVYRSITREVNADGTLGDESLSVDTWYGETGQVIKSADAAGLFSKTIYDGLGRATISYTSFDSGEMIGQSGSYAQAASISGDTVVQQSRTFYNGNRAVAFATFQRFDDDATTVGALDATNSYATASAVWYDAAGRQTHTATFGREDVLSPIDVAARYMFDEDGNLIDADADGLPDIAEGAPLAPNSSDNYIVSQTQYNPAGQAYRGIDNLGRITHTEFDLLGRVTRTIENYVDGLVRETEPSDTDRVTQRIYDSAGRLAILRALNPKGSGNGVEQQNTRYLYENPLNGSWVTSTIYPDSTDTDSTGTDQVKVTYDRLGRQLTVTDQRGVLHTYNYDTAGRLAEDVVTTCPTGVDDSVLTIGYEYDDIGRVTSVTSYDDAAERGDSHVANQIVYAFDTWGNVARSWQSHQGLVDNDGQNDDDTPSVQYAYETGTVDGAAKYIRLAGITYPDGRVVSYSYGSAGGIHDILSRVAAITEGSATYAEYQYLGAGTITAVTYPGVAGNMTLDYDLAGGNVLDGWDRFGRIVEQTWTVNDQPVDSYSYTYDRNSSRLTRKNNLNPSLSETYTYDGLNRLVDTDRGEGQQQVAFQSWELDQLGNWTSFCGPIQYPNPQTRTHNAANEITSIDGSSANTAHDAAGNMVTMPSALDPADTHHAVYDAWNRMVAVYEDDGDGVLETGAGGDALISEYEYDGQRRRIVSTVYAAGVASTQTDTFFNEAWQVLEERSVELTSLPVNQSTTQYVWDQRYIDSPVVRFFDGNGDGDYLDGVDNVVHYANDANFNVTALILPNGAVAERYSYESYGKVEVRLGDWTETAFGSAYGNVKLFCGYEYDQETGLYDVRNRPLHPVMGRLVQRDDYSTIIYSDRALPSLLPQYADGQNLYVYVKGMPLAATDPFGRLCNVTVHQKDIRLKTPRSWGHRWIEWDSGSMGFWPQDSCKNLLSCPGERLMPDPYSGDRSGPTWQTERKASFFHGIMGKAKLVDGIGRGKTCECATCGEIIDCLRKYSERYDPKQNSAGVRYRLVSFNCRDFVNIVTRACCLEY